MENTAVITSVIAGFTALVGVFLKFINDMNKAQAKRDEVFIKNLQHNTTAMKAVANATTKSAKEAAERNGHLAELAIENKNSTLKAIRMIQSNVKEQHVDRQVVDNQEVKS